MKKIKLFCIPYAGGSATVFYKLVPYLKNNIELIPIELAGRGSRFDEKLYDNFNLMVGDVYNQIIRQIDDNSIYAILGYSMGGVVLYEVLQKLKSKAITLPRYAIYAAIDPPHLYNFVDPIHLYDEEQFIEKIIGLGGVSYESDEEMEIFKTFIPILRSDFKLVYEYKKVVKIGCIDKDIIVLFSEDELENVSEWRQYTTQKCNLYKMQGGHFFINTQVKEMTDIVNTILIDM